MDVRVFFRVTGLLLVLFAAGLMAHGVHELQEAALLPTVVEHVWDTNPIVSEDSTIGEFLKALLGYNGNPSLIEVLSYLAYYVVILVGIRWSGKRRMRIAGAAQTKAVGDNPARHAA